MEHSNHSYLIQISDNSDLQWSVSHVSCSFLFWSVLDFLHSFFFFFKSWIQFKALDEGSASPDRIYVFLAGF